MGGEDQAATEEAKRLKKKKKKKKIRYPKNYNADSDRLPDPERWLPRRERSYAKKARKKRNAPAMSGSQGGAMTAKEATKLAGLDKSDKRGTSADATTGSAREGNGQAVSRDQADKPVPVQEELPSKS